MSLLQKEEADRIAISYTPRKFPATISGVAKDFHRFQTGDEKTDFRIDRAVAINTGISELERLSMEEKVELAALQKLKEIEESAYKEAYALGLDEGREKAFAQFKGLIEDRLVSLEQLAASIDHLKADLITFNEAHIMKILNYMASRIAMDEVRAKPDTILSVLRAAIDSAQTEEKVSVKISAADLKFVNEMRDKLGRDMEMVKRIKFEEDESVQAGGCIIETNYGIVDATIEQRVTRLWESLKEKLPRVVDKVGDGQPAISVEEAQSRQAQRASEIPPQEAIDPVHLASAVDAAGDSEAGEVSSGNDDDDRSTKEDTDE